MAWGNKHEDRSLRELLRLETLQRRKNKSLHRGKTGIKLNIQKTKIMASGPISSWQIDGEKMETVIDFNVLGSKITADGDCSHEIKRQHRQHILKQRHFFAYKDLSNQSYGFSSSHVWM